MKIIANTFVTDVMYCGMVSFNFLGRYSVLYRILMSVNAAACNRTVSHGVPYLSLNIYPRIYT
jgi:hypothetical protein